MAFGSLAVNTSVNAFLMGLHSQSLISNLIKYNIKLILQTMVPNRVKNGDKKPKHNLLTVAFDHDCHVMLAATF